MRTVIPLCHERFPRCEIWRFYAHLASFMSFTDLSWVLTSLTGIQSRNVLFTNIINHPSIVYQQPFSRCKNVLASFDWCLLGVFSTFPTSLKMKRISQSKSIIIRRWFQVVSFGYKFFPSSSKFAVISPNS